MSVGASVRGRTGLLVRGGTVIDGTGRQPHDSDVQVVDGVIVQVGPRLDGDGLPELDARGCLVTPGFIDGHTHFDASIFWDPLCDPMPQHGVTTVIVGNCSLSLAPVATADRDQMLGAFAYIEDMPAELLRAGVPWAWESFTEYLSSLRQRHFGVHVGCLVGHTMLRQYVMGEAAWYRSASDSERSHMVAALDGCLDAGGVGLSVSLFDEDASGRPVPSRLADDDELADLVAVLSTQGRVLSFIPNVARHADMMSGVERVARLCQRAGVVAMWNGLFHDERRPERSAEVLAHASRLQLEGVRVLPQVSPRSLDVQVNWRGGMAFYSLEPWHRVLQASEGEKAGLLRDARWREEARYVWDAAPRTLLRHKELDRIRLTAVTRAEHERWVGATLADLVAARGGHASDVLADWVLANDLHPGVVGVGVANADPAGVAELLTHPATVIANSDAGAHVQMMCGAGDTTLLLARHVRDRADLSIERAVWELTSRQAALYGLHDRGVIAAGRVADLAIFDLDELTWEAEVVVNDLPGGTGRLRRPPGGYRFTVVAGRVTQQEGRPTGDLPGTVVRGPALRPPRAGQP